MRLRSLIRKEFRQFRRDRRLFGMAIMAPIIQLTLIGYAANLDVKGLPVAICDEDLSRESGRLVSEVAYSGYFRVAASSVRSEDLIPLLARGRAQLALDIPHNFGRDSRTGKAQVQIVLDGSDSNSAGIGAGYLSGIVLQHGARALVLQRTRAGGPPVPLPQLDLRPRILYNPQLASLYHMVPAVLGLVLLVITSNLTALSIVREREAGTLEQVMVTPVRAWELMLGKLVPYALVATFDLLLVLAVVLFWFQVPLRGSFLFLLGSALLFLLTCLGLGLVVSTVSRTQQQAQMTIFLVIFPSIILSGFMFPIENMPDWMQPLTYAIPLRYFLVIIRAVMLKGSGLPELWPNVLALALFAVGLVGAGAALFHKRLS